MNRLLPTSVLAIAAIFLLCGCSGEEESGILLYCGAGIRPPVDELAAIFEDEEGIEVILSRLTLSRTGDLFMPGDRFYMDQADEAGLVLEREPVCRFVPVILVRKGNPKNISRLEDLLRPAVKLGLGDPEACAVGRKSRKIFASIGVKWDELRSRTAYLAQTVNDLGLQVRLGLLDAVIVWDAVAEYYRNDAEVVAIPEEQNIISCVDLGLLTFTGNREAAKRFMEFTRSSRGKEIFTKHGYGRIPVEDYETEK